MPIANSAFATAPLPTTSSRATNSTGASWGSLDIRNGTGLALEKTPSYFRSPHVLRGINKLLPSARLVLLLREPAARAYSHFRMTMAFKHRDARNDARSFHETAVKEVKQRCASALSPTTLSACLRRLHACGKSASDDSCAALARKVYKETHQGYIERSVYANGIRSMYGIGWGCDRVAIIVSEQFKVQPTMVLRRLWKALGVPHDVVVSSDHQGKAPGSGEKEVREKKVRDVVATQDMRNDTRHMLESFFRPDVYDVAGLVPALNLHLWWPAYFHGSRSANAVPLSSM